MAKFNTLRGTVTGDEPTDFEESFSHHATLRIFSESGLDFGAIESTLRLAPTAIRRRGQRAGSHGPPSKHDVWMYRAPVAEHLDLPEHIDALWGALKPKADFLRDLKRSAEVEVYLGYSSNVDHAGVHVPRRSLEIFTELDLAFQLSIVVLGD